MSLKKQAVSGMIWTFSQQFGTQLVNFVIGIVLARVLLPSDFGTIALFGVVMSVASALINGGLSSSLIRTKDADDADLSTVFWFNLVASLSIYTVIFFISPIVSDFYDLPQLTLIIRVYALILIPGALGSIQSIRFVKEMDFKTSFKIQLPSILIGGVSGILFAYYGFGVWSLVYYPLIQGVISNIQFWMYSDWRPAFIFDKQKFKYHFNFGYKMTLSELLNTIFNNVYSVIIGKIFSPVQLGYYNRADSLKQLPVSNLSNALNSVTFPLFSQLRDNNIKLKEVYKKLMKVVIFIIAPILCFAIIVAEPLIRLLLSEKWLPSVSYFQILAIAGIMYPIHSYNLNILKVKGRSDLFLKLEIIKKTLVVFVLVASIRYGMYGILWGQVLLSFISFFINTHYTGKILEYGTLQQISDLMPIILLSASIAVVIYFSDLFFFHNWLDLPRLLVLAFLYAGLYLGTVWIFKFREINYLKDLLKK